MFFVRLRLCNGRESAMIHLQKSAGEAGGCAVFTVHLWQGWNGSGRDLCQISPDWRKYFGYAVFTALCQEPKVKQQ